MMLKQNASALQLNTRIVQHTSLRLVARRCVATEQETAAAASAASDGGEATVSDVSPDSIVDTCVEQVRESHQHARHSSIILGGHVAVAQHCQQSTLLHIRPASFLLLTTTSGLEIQTLCALADKEDVISTGQPSTSSTRGAQACSHREALCQQQREH